MSFFDEIRKLTQPYDESDEDYFDDDTAPESDDEPTQVARRHDRASARTTWDDPFQSDARAPSRGEEERRPAYHADGRPVTRERSDFVPEAQPVRGASSDERVINIHTTTSVQVVMARPERFGDAAAIADHLRAGRTVVINLETTQKDEARRLIDFLSGVAYANDGKIKKAAINTYTITPYNMDIMGDLMDELENSGVSFY